MNRDKLLHLIEQYKSGQCTDKERIEFELWYAQLGQDDPNLNLNPSERRRLRIWHKLMQQEAMAPLANRHAKNPWKFNLMSIKPFLAAAILLMVLGGMIYVYQMRDRSSSETYMETVLQDVTPGGNRATLTLSDGSTVDLKAMEAGKGIQGQGLHITKIADGVLTYQEENSKDEEVQYHTIRTPRGGQYQVVLPDSTVVWLNAASSLRYPTRFTDKSREVQLSGEAYFEVSKLTSKGKRVPFIVKTQGQEVQVLGTHFNIKAYQEEEETTTTLLEGKVKVVGYAGYQQETQSHILQVGQASHWKNGQYNIEAVDVERAIAWKNNEFIFSGENIKTIMNNIARWYDVQVVFQGDLSGVNFEGSVSRYEDIVEVLRKLELTGTVHFQAVPFTEGNEKERRIIVMP